MKPSDSNQLNILLYMAQLEVLILSYCMTKGNSLTRSIRVACALSNQHWNHIESNNCHFLVYFSWVYKKGVLKNMEINNTTFSVFMSYRLFGLAPYKIVRNQSRRIIDFTLNRWLCVYGWIILIIYACVANYIIFQSVYCNESSR